MDDKSAKALMESINRLTKTTEKFAKAFERVSRSLEEANRKQTELLLLLSTNKEPSSDFDGDKQHQQHQ